MIKVAVWASGSGSNAENIALRLQREAGAEVALILTNHADAGVIARAERLGIACQHFTNAEFKAATAPLAAMAETGIDWIFLGGFMRLVPTEVIRAYPGRMVNIHPALLPAFGGKGMYGQRVHQAVVAAGAAESGITIHEVNEHYDEGQVLFQARVAVSAQDTAADVERKVRALEVHYYPEVAAALVLGRPLPVAD